MPYLWMTAAICLSVANSSFLHRMGVRFFNHTGDLFLFNGALSLVWSVILGILCLVSRTLCFTPTVLIFGVVYGILLCTFLLFKNEAMVSGPLSLTTLIGCCAFMIVVGYTAVFERTLPTLWQAVGIAGLLVALVLCTLTKSAERPKKRWYVFSFLFLLAGGAVGILYKEFGKTGESINEMMLIASLFSALLFTVCAFLFNKKTDRPRLKRGALPYLLLCGVTGCLYIRMNIALTPQLPSAVFFPVSNGASVMLSVLFGRLFFKEKLRVKQTIGIAIGLVSIVINGCFDVFFG